MSAFSTGTHSFGCGRGRTCAHAQMCTQACTRTRAHAYVCARKTPTRAYVHRHTRPRVPLQTRLERRADLSPPSLGVGLVHGFEFPRVAYWSFPKQQTVFFQKIQAKKRKQTVLYQVTPNLSDAENTVLVDSGAFPKKVQNLKRPAQGFHLWPRCPARPSSLTSDGVLWEKGGGGAPALQSPGEAGMEPRCTNHIDALS